MGNKGTPFEREIATKLSLWWTGEERSDVFWRTGGSGGRARVRGRKGKQTHNQHGDIFSVDPIGKPFTDLFVIELKRGYPRNTIQDLIDNPLGKPVKDSFAEWVIKAEESRELSDCPYWLLIVKRDRRKTLAFFPSDSNPVFKLVTQDCAGVRFSGPVGDYFGKGPGCSADIIGVDFDGFLDKVSPKRIIAYMEGD